MDRATSAEAACIPAPGLWCERRQDLLDERVVWVLQCENRFDQGRTLLLSKVSEAVHPNAMGNQVGAGSTLDEFVVAQQGVRLVLNGGFNHYRKDFYAWPHQAYNIGDPVGLVKIREHRFEDLREPALYGFFVQHKKGEPWRIVCGEHLDQDSKYILGCTPLLVLDGRPLSLPSKAMTPLAPGEINPPSALNHGLQRHPRSAVGIKGARLVFLVVEGGPGRGCTLLELQQVGLRLQLDHLLNLDGGGSSQFRLRTDDGWLRNVVEPEDEQRVLGNVIALFDESLKNEDGRSLAAGYVPSSPSRQASVRPAASSSP